jgi:uncharacterized protein YaiI (UPF0178 family)
VGPPLLHFSRGNLVTNIYIDADACPVKDEVYRVARRHGLKVRVVSNMVMRVPQDGSVESVVVPGKLDAADDWIVEQVLENDIIVSADIPLASRCAKKKARVITPKGRVFTEESVCNAVATRDLMTFLRDSGEVTGGPAPFGKKDRSHFLQSLEDVIRAALKEDGRKAP